MAYSHHLRPFVRLLQKARRLNLQEAGEPLPVFKKTARLSRRKFVKFATLATGTAISTGLLNSQRAHGQQKVDGTPTIAIIGGGIGGLNAAHQLRKQGYLATIYEARNRLGGRMFTRIHPFDNDLIVDMGGSFVNSDHEDMLALVNEFGLSLFDTQAYQDSFSFPSTAYHFNGRAYSERELAELMRPLVAQITADADLLDQDYDAYAPVIDAQSVEEYLALHQDKVSPVIYTLLLGGIRSEYGVDFDESSALQLMFMLPTVDGDRIEVVSGSDEAYMINGGSSSLINALGESLAGQIQLNMPLLKLESLEDGRFSLSFRNRQSILADYVILTLPFTALRRVDMRVKLPNLLHRFIREVDLGHNEKVIVGFNQRRWLTQETFSSELWCDFDYSLVWDASQRQLNQENAALTFFLGGTEVDTPRFITRRQPRLFTEQLEAVLPGISQTIGDRHLRTAWGEDPYSQGSYTNFKPAQLTTFGDYFYIESDDPEERVDVHEGNLVFAGEHLSDEFYGFMNGGAQTGRLAANVVMRLMNN